MIIGYARVSTEDQNLDLQITALKAAGADIVVEEWMSGKNRNRPILQNMLRDLQPGDIVLAWKLDRIARSLSDLLHIIDTIERAGAFFRCTTTPIDTASPAGRLMLQMLGAVAEFERSLILERTRAGMAAAIAAGKAVGNPGLLKRDPVARRKLAEGRQRAFNQRVIATMEEWRPIVVKMRPHSSWHAVADAVSTHLKRPFSRDLLLRHVKQAAAEGLISKSVLDRAPASHKVRGIGPAGHVLLAALRRRPGVTLADLAAELEAASIPTPRGQKVWPLSSVDALKRRVLEAHSESR